MKVEHTEVSRSILLTHISRCIEAIEEQMISIKIKISNTGNNNLIKTKVNFFLISSQAQSAKRSIESLYGTDDAE